MKICEYIMLKTAMKDLKKQFSGVKNRRREIKFFFKM